MSSAPSVRSLLEETSLTSRQRELVLSRGYQVTPDPFYYYREFKSHLNREERRQFLSRVARGYYSDFLGTEYDSELEEKLNYSLKKTRLKRLEELVELISAPETRIREWQVFFNWMDLPSPSPEVDLDREISRLQLDPRIVHLNSEGIQKYARDRRLSHLVYSSLSTARSKEELSSSRELLRVLIDRHYQKMGVKLSSSIWSHPLITSDRTERVCSRPEKYPFLPRLPQKIYYHRKFYWKLHLRFSSHWNLSYWERRVATVPKFPHHEVIVRKLDSVTNDRLRYIQSISELISLRNYSKEDQKEALTLMIADLGKGMVSRYIQDSPEDQSLVEELYPDYPIQILNMIYLYRFQEGNEKRNQYFKERYHLYQIWTEE